MAKLAPYEVAALDHVKEKLTDLQRLEVDIWWCGRLPDGFWERVSKPAYNAIFTLIGYGLG